MSNDNSSKTEYPLTSYCVPSSYLLYLLSQRLRWSSVKMCVVVYYSVHRITKIWTKTILWWRTKLSIITGKASVWKHFGSSFPGECQLFFNFVKNEYMVTNILLWSEINICLVNSFLPNIIIYVIKYKLVFTSFLFRVFAFNIFFFNCDYDILLDLKYVVLETHFSLAIDQCRWRWKLF